jgi:cysteinyl-tRNA synthetase
MLTVGGQKMSKSLGNSFLPHELFSGQHKLLEKGYEPMAVRFFMLQTHYRSTLDFSNEALQASEKGFERLMESYKTLQTLVAAAPSSENIDALEAKCYEAMNDDFNAPVLVANLFEGARIINSVNDGKETITAEDLTLLKKTMRDFTFSVLGLADEKQGSGNETVVDGLMQTILGIRQQAKANKDFATSDQIRDKLAALNIVIKDGKDGATWELN